MDKYQPIDLELANYDPPSPNSSRPTFLSTEYVSIKGLRYSQFRSAIYVLLSVLSFGILAIIGKQYPAIRCYISRTYASKFRESDTVLVETATGSQKEVKLQVIDITDEMRKYISMESQNSRSFIYFEFRKQRYIYQQTSLTFERLEVRLKTNISSLIELKAGLSSAEASFLSSYHGENEIGISKVEIGDMLFDKLLHPFYIFQIFSTFLWIFEKYYTYAFIILGMSIVSVIWEIYIAKQNEKNLRSLAISDSQVKVVRDSAITYISSKNLVVGDAVIIENSTTNKVVCDMVIVQGHSIILDESSLTGESLPVVKTPISSYDNPYQEYTIEAFKKHTLYSGATFLQIIPNENIIQKNPSNDLLMSNVVVGFEIPQNVVIGVVTATGFSSTKGALFRQILYPKEIDFKFYRDSYKFIALLSIVGMIAFIKNIVDGMREKKPFVKILVQSIDLMTIAVPPALPLVLTVGIGFALSRLRKKRIFCIDPARLNFAGSLDVMCWDKTGTLTTPTQSWFGFEPVINSLFTGFKKEIDTTNLETNSFETCISTCHGLNLVNGKLIGHSVDTEMFSASQCTMSKEMPSFFSFSSAIRTYCYILNKRNECISIVKMFDFDSNVQRNSIVCYKQGNNTDPNDFFVFTKGSPESVKGVCSPSSIPLKFNRILEKYTSKGYYVLACAYKPLKKLSHTSPNNIEKIKRREIETDLIFLGFFILENPLKPESKSIINQLNFAKIRSIIITGDTTLTALHTARELSICDKSVIVDLDQEGEVMFRENINSTDNDVKDSFDSFGSRFESTELNQPLEDLPRYVTLKKVPIDILVSCSALDNIVNNCGEAFVDWIICRGRIFSAAKPHHKSYIIETLIKNNFVVGMCGDGANDCGALKAAHIGLALSDTEASIVAPFTSASKSISDVLNLLAEGRCSLETSFYMALYPIIELLASATLYSLGASFSNNQFLFDDLILVLFTAIFLCRTSPSKILSKFRPTNDLFNHKILLSIVGQAIICLTFFYINLALLTSQPWFCDVKKAISGVDQTTWIPFNITAPQNVSYPCYYINPLMDVTPEFPVVVTTFETTGVWIFSHVQYITVALAFSVYSNHRQPFFTNVWYTLYLLISSGVCVWLFFISDDTNKFSVVLKNFLNIRDGIPKEFRFWICVLGIVNGIVLGCWEYFLVGEYLTPWVHEREQKQRHSRAMNRAKMAGAVEFGAVYSGLSGLNYRGMGISKSCSFSNLANEDANKSRSL